MKRPRAWCAFLMLLSFASLSAEQRANGERSTTAPTVTFAYLCSSLAGTYIGAPNWRPEPDATTGQRVLLHYKGEGVLGEIAWYMGDDQYYKTAGLGVSMKSGFALIVFADDRLETYVYSAATTDLLYTQTRSGNDVLPNAVKAYRGTCRPAGNLVR